MLKYFASSKELRRWSYGTFWDCSGFIWIFQDFRGTVWDLFGFFRISWDYSGFLGIFPEKRTELFTLRYFGGQIVCAVAVTTRVIEGWTCGVSSTIINAHQ